ncbi:MAG TPA: hypothetical protein VMW35_11400 [Myxococcota bacterium]|jgi:hypothetical protein|nr:hypothetical protein [Myxococcota bacterium]
MEGNLQEKVRRWLAPGQIGLAALFLLAVGLLVARALRSPEVPLLPTGDAAWIYAAIPPQTSSRWIDPEHPAPHAFFERRFTTGAPRGPVTLRMRALRDVVLRVNGHEVPLRERDPRRWKEASVVDLAPLLVVGENALRVEVRNPDGIALLQLRVDGLDSPLSTDDGWLAGLEGEPLGPPAIASEPVRFAGGAALPAPLPSTQRHVLALAGLAAGGMALFARLRGRPGSAALAPVVARGLVLLFWAWVVVMRILRIPTESGFDSVAHVDYVEAILATGRLPLAHQGLEMYHPPLFYVVTALLLALLQPAHGGAFERLVYSLLPVLAGVGMVFVAAATARLLSPASAWIEAGSIVAAGFLPMSLTLSATVSNEAPHAFVASLALLLALRALVAPSTTRRDDLALGLVLGVGLLTKYSSAVLVPLLLGAVAVKRWMLEGATPSRAASGALRALAVVLAVAGWFYARNLLYYRDVFAWPLDMVPGTTLWQYPGFHTPGYFLRFGDALVQPWFSGFHAFWDAVYTTFFGDGMLGGAGGVEYVHGVWRYDWMATVFLLALPAPVFLLVGWLRAARGALRDECLRRRLALTLVVGMPPVLVASMLSINLKYAYWSFGKAFYALFLGPTLSWLAVLGFEALDRVLARRAPVAVRALPWGWAAAFFGAIAFAYGG